MNSSHKNNLLVRHFQWFLRLHRELAEWASKAIRELIIKNNCYAELITAKINLLPPRQFQCF